MANPHLNLDDLAPPDITVTFRGVEYQLPGEVPIATIIECVNLQEQFESATDTRAQMALIERMYRIVMEVFRDRNAEIPDLRFTSSEVGYLIGFIASGGDMQDLESAVLGAVVGDDQEREAARPTKARTGARGSGVKQSKQRRSA